MPVDVYYIQLQSQESRHALRKGLAFNTNKHKPKEVAARVKQVQAYIRAGKTVKGHTKSTGVCRNYAILKKSLLHGYLVDLFETQASIAIKQERSEARKRRRHQALVRSKGSLLASVTTEQAILQQKISEAVRKELTGTGTSDEEETEKREAAADEQKSSSDEQKSGSESSSYSRTDPDDR